MMKVVAPPQSSEACIDDRSDRSPSANYTLHHEISMGPSSQANARFRFSIPGAQFQTPVATAGRLSNRPWLRLEASQHSWQRLDRVAISLIGPWPSAA